MRDEASELARRMLESPADLIQRARQLLGLLRSLGLDDSAEATVFKVIDSEADAWPIGVSDRLLEPGYWQRCQEEMRRYSIETWPSARAGCEGVLALLSARPNKA